jgi:hypothetical protein
MALRDSSRMDRTSVFPARYSFVLARQNGWLIAHQHSSLQREPQGA